ILLSRAAANVLLLFVVVLGSYEIPLLLGRQSPQMLSVLTFRKYQRFDLLDKPQAFACSILYTLFALTVVVLALGRGTSSRMGRGGWGGPAPAGGRGSFSPPSVPCRSPFSSSSRSPAAGRSRRCGRARPTPRPGGRSSAAAPSPPSSSPRSPSRPSSPPRRRR